MAVTTTAEAGGARAATAGAVGPAGGARAAKAADKLRQATALVKAAVVLSVPEETAPGEAAELAGMLGGLEKLAAAGALRYSRQLGRGASGLLATVSGTATGAARRKLETAEALDKAPEIAAAFSRGELSSDQAKAIAPVASVSPEEATSLLQTAKSSSLKELRAEAERTLRRRRSEDDEVARERRIHGRRYCRAYPAPGGGVRLEALLGTADGALLLACLDKEADALYKESHRAGIQEPQDHLLADALVGLVTGSARAQGAHVTVRVNAETLQRGELGAGEVCEIEGVGPISVETARRLLGEGFFTVLVKSGKDIDTVSSMTRTVYRRLDEALKERDRSCVVPGCAATKGLERHHWRRDYDTFGPTELDNMCRLCRVHHDMGTKEGWKILGGPGKWKLYPPKARRRPGPTAGPPGWSTGPPARSP